MNDERLPYVKPQLLVLEQTADVRVSMTNNCKTVTSGNGSGGNFGSCFDTIGNVCSNVS
jgi:hypothetical protein